MAPVINDKDDLNDAKMNLFDSIIVQIISEIKVNRIGAYMTNIVKRDSLPYTVQEGQENKGIWIRDIVVKTTKLKLVHSRKYLRSSEN